MTRKHFQQMADRFAWLAGDPTTDRSTLVKCAHEFAALAQSVNPNFDRARFLTACKLGE